MTTRTAELLMGLATLAASLGLMAKIFADGLVIGWIEGRGPGSGMWPFWLSCGMALASLATLARWLRGATAESRSKEPYIAPETAFLVGVSVAALVAFLLLINIVGTYLALVAFMYFYVRVLGKHSWRATIAIALGTPVFCYALFEVALTKYLPKGLPVFEEAFLVIDNIRWQLLG